MKEYKLQEVNPLKHLQNILWESLSLIRGNAPDEEYHFFFFLLTLKRYDLLSPVSSSNVSDVTNILQYAVRNFDGENADDLKRISGYYLHISRRITPRILFDVLHLYSSINQELLKEYFSEVFDGLLYRYLKSQGRASGESILPIELGRFVTALANPSDSAKVYNPFAGLASFSIFLKDGPEYFGQEINEATWALGSLRILAYDRKGTSEIALSDSIESWNPFASSIEMEPEDNFGFRLRKQKYDIIISNPPFGARLSTNLRSRFGNVKSCEHFLIENGIEDLKEDGRLIAVLSNRFLFAGGSEYQLREYLIKKDLLETVISFPGGLLMNTGIPVTVIVINKNKKEKEKIRFIDAKKFIETTSGREKRLNDYALCSFIDSNMESHCLEIVSNEKVISYDFNLNVARYFRKYYQGVPLREIGSLIRGQRVVEGQIGKFVRTRDLKDDSLDYKLSLVSIEDAEVPRHAQKVIESCVLLAARWRTLKPTHFNYTGTPIYISVDIIAFRVDESNYDIAFLINELHSAYVVEQLDSLKVGAVMPTIRREDLLSVIISLPNLDNQSSLKEQRALINQRLLDLANEKKRELTLFNKIHGLEAEIVEQNTYLRHTLAGPSSNLKDSISNIKKIILEKVAPGHSGLLKLKLSDKHLVTLGEYLEIIERDASKIVSAVTSQLKVDTGIEGKELIPIERIGFMEKYSVEYNERTNLNFKIDFDLDKEVFIENGERVKTFIAADADLLRDLFDNLIGNARKHAFEREANNRIEIYLMKNTESEDVDQVQILFSNTGKPFPEGFTISDFIRKGSKTGDNAGDGYGGWYINEIIKKFNGDFDIIDETGGEGLPQTDLATSFEINFPIVETEENV